MPSTIDSTIIDAVIDRVLTDAGLTRADLARSSWDQTSKLKPTGAASKDRLIRERLRLRKDDV